MRFRTTVTVRRTGGSSGPVSVTYATDDFVRPLQATWIKRHTDLLYPTDTSKEPIRFGDGILTQGAILEAIGKL